MVCHLECFSLQHWCADWNTCIEQSIIASEAETHNTTELDDLDTQNGGNHTIASGSSPAQVTNIESGHPHLERFVRTGVPKPKEELFTLAAMTVAPEDFDDTPVTARRIAMISSRIWFAHTCLYTYVGLGWNFYELELSIFISIIIWKSFRVFLVVKRICNQIYFVRIEAEVRVKNSNRLTSSSQQPLALASPGLSRISVTSTQLSTTRSPSVSAPASPSLQPQTSRRESWPDSLPGQDTRHGSEANAPVQGDLTYRGTFPFTQE